MPNKHAAVKDLRKNKRRAARNLRMKTHVKTLTKKINELLKAGNAAEAKALFPKAQQAIAKADKKNLLHTNKASRNIGSLAKKLK